MGSVVPFSAANDYVSELVGKGQPVRAILDTNVLIAISYEIKEAHEQVVDLIRSLEKMGVSFFATVTTKAAVNEIRKSVASMKSKQARDGSDPIFNDSQIKSIKAEFSAFSRIILIVIERWKTNDFAESF